MRSKRVASRKARSSASFVVMTSSGSAPAVFEVDAATGGVTLAVPPQPGVSGTLVITVEAQTPGTLLMYSFVVRVTLNGQPNGALGEAMTLTLEVDPAVAPSGETSTLFSCLPPFSFDYSLFAPCFSSLFNFSKKAATLYVIKL
jgi:hypothetical protein